MPILDQLAFAPRGMGPLSLSLEGGQLVLLCGPSGSGKTTLCQLLSGELEATSGHIVGTDGRIATMTADVESQLLGSTVKQELELSSLVCRESDPARNSQLEALRLALTARWREMGEVDPQDLSLGEQQLLLLTSIVMGSFPLLILDEGLSCLDSASFVEVFKVLRALAASGVVIVVVSHELRVLPWVDRCIALDEGQIAFDRSSADVTWTDVQRVRLWTGTLTPPVDSGSSVMSDGRAPTVSAEPPLGLSTAAIPEALIHFGALEVSLSSTQALAVAGVAGSGKSRFLLALANLAAMPGWRVEDSPLYRVLLQQQPQGILWHRTVRAELEASLSEGRRRDRTTALSVDDLSEIPTSWLERSPRSLSRGELKLVACLCLILQRPDLLVLDQPFAGLDAHLRECLETRLRAYLRGKGRLVFSTLSPDEMVLYPNRLLVLDDACPSYFGEAEDYFRNAPDPRLGRPYAWGLGDTQTQAG